MSLRAVIYLRQSLDAKGDGLGVARQEQECRRLCELRGWDVAQVLCDNSRSASTGQRPAYQQLTSIMEHGETDVVVVLRMDRLLRRLTELEALIELCEKTGVQVATVYGDLDLSSSQGRLVGRLLASVARAEVEVKSERHKLANAQKAAAGKPHGSRRPYGYQADLVTLHDEEADVLHRMGERIIAGHSFKEVAYWANEQGYRTTTGKMFYPLTVRNMLRKKRYGGIREYEGTEYAAVWPAVFEHHIWQQLQYVISCRQNTGEQVSLKNRQYLLTGLLICGRCGNKLTGTRKQDRAGKPMRRIYSCRSSGDTQRKEGCSLRRNADALDCFLRDAVIYRLDSPDLGKLLQSGKGDDVNGIADLVTIRSQHVNRIAMLDDMLGDGDLTRVQYVRQAAKVQCTIDALDREINALSRSSALTLAAGQTIRAAYDANGNDWRRELIKLVINSITVNPGDTKPFYEVDGHRYRFDPSLIQIEWVDQERML